MVKFIGLVFSFPHGYDMQKVKLRLFFCGLPRLVRGRLLVPAVPRVFAHNWFSHSVVSNYSGIQ